MWRSLFNLSQTTYVRLCNIFDQENGATGQLENFINYISWGLRIAQWLFRPKSEFLLENLWQSDRVICFDFQYLLCVFQVTVSVWSAVSVRWGFWMLIRLPRYLRPLPKKPNRYQKVSRCEPWPPVYSLIQEVQKTGFSDIITWKLVQLETWVKWQPFSW